MTPFRAPAPTSPESRYNLALAKTRYGIVTQTIGHLRNRFQCLGEGGRYSTPLRYPPETCAQIITVCAALHNICIHYNVEFPEMEFENERMLYLWSEKNDNKMAKGIRSKIMDNLPIQ